MGNMSTGEKIGISIIAIIAFPFMLIGNALKHIGQALGIIEQDKELEYDPTKDPNSPDYKE
jgi:hypothetical protein